MQVWSSQYVLLAKADLRFIAFGVNGFLHARFITVSDF
jgi:hypothetical protein